jgi:predicted nucleotidyltransferase
MIVLVFGSFIKKQNTSFSDVDLCIISDNGEKNSKLIEKLGLLSLKLEIHEFTTKEFISMIEKKQNNLGNEIVKSNIILYGIENYYTLISKWTKKE